MSDSNDAGPRQVHPFLAAFRGPDKRTVVHLYRDKNGPTEPAQVGVLLVDLARHYARMFTQLGQTRSEDEALEEIRRLFDSEWDSPTDPGEGRIPS